MIHSHIRTKSGDSQQHFTDNEFPEEKIKLSQYLLTLPVSGSDTTQSRIVDFSHKSIEEIDPVSTSLALRYIELKGDSNYLTSLRNISQFQLLRKISLRDNEIENIENIYYLRSLVDLEELDLRGNVIVGQPEYMNLVLLLLPKLRILDGKAVKSDKKKEIPLMMKQNLALIDQFIVNESEIIKLESVVKTLKFHQALYHKYDIYCHSHVPFDLQRLLKELSVTENTDDTFKMYIRQSLLRYLDIGQSLLNPKIRSHGHKVLADQTFKINELLKEADNLNISLTEFVRNTLDTSDMRYKEESQTTFYSILSEDDAWKSAQSILPGLNMSVTSRIWNYPIPEETEPSSREASYIMPPTETAMHSFRMEVAEVLAGYDNGHGHTRNRSDQTQSFEEGEGGQTILQETQENKFEKSAETPTNRQGQVRKSSFYEREQEKKNELKKQFRMGQNRNDKENSLGDQKIYIQTGYSPEKERSAEKVAFKQIDEKHHGKMPTEEEEEEEELVDEVSKYNIIRFLRAKYLNFLCPHRNTHKYLQHQLISLGRRKDKQVLRASFDKLLANFFQHHASQANIGLENKKVEENLTKPHQIKKKTKGVQTGQRSIRNRKKGSPRAKFMQLLERTLRETQDNVKELSEELETLKEKYVVKEAELFRKDLELYNKEQEYIAELDDYVQKEQQLEGRLSERESNWTQREHDYLEKYKTFEQKESIYQGKDEEYSRKEQEYASKDLEYAQKEKYFDEKIEQYEAKEREFAEKEQACNRKAQELAQKEKEFAEKIEQYEIKQKEYAGKEEHYMQRIAESERLRAEIEKQYQLKEEENAKAGKHLGEREQVYANKLKEYENEIQQMASEIALSKQIQEEMKRKDDIYAQKEQEYKNKDEVYAKKDQEHDEKEKRHAALSEQYKQKLARDAKEKEELEKKYKLKDEEYASKDEEYKRKEKEHKEYEARVAQEDAFRTQMEKVYAIQEEDFAKKDKEFARKAELYLAKDREYAERERGYQARDHGYAQQVAQDMELLNQKQYEYEEKERVLQQKEEEYQAREQSYVEKERQIEQREKQFAELDNQYKQKVEHFEQQNQALKKEYQMKDQVYATKEELFATKTQEFEDKEKEYVERDRLYMERIAKDAELRKEMEEVYKKKDEEYAEKENKYVELEEEVRAKEDELNAMKEEFHMVLSIKEEEIGQKHEECKQKELEFIAREKLFEEEYNFYKSKDEEYGHKEREFAQKEHEFEELQKEFLAEDERKAVMIVELQDELLSKEKEYAKKMKEHMQKEEGWRIKEQECVDIYLQIKEAYAEKDAEYARKDDEYKAREAHYAAQEKRLAEMQANAQGTEESPEKETIDFLEKEMEVTLEEERKEHEEEVAKYTETINTQTDKIKELEAQCAKLQEALETNEREKELLNKTLKRNTIKTDAGVQVAIQERPLERSYKLQNSPASISRNLIQDLHKAEDKVFDIEIEPLGNLRYKQYDKVMNRHTGFKSPGTLLRSDMEVLKELPRDENLKTETEDHLSLSFLNSGKKGFGSQTESVFNGQSLNESKGVKSQLISGRIYRRGTMQKDSLANSLLETSTEPIDKILGADAEYLKERKIDDNFGLSGPSILWNLSIEKELKSPRELVKESVQSNQKRATVEEPNRENLQGRVSNIETLKKTTQALYENLQEKAKLRQEKLKARLGAM